MKLNTSRRCDRIWYNDWECVECCSGDRCNYYITVRQHWLTQFVAPTATTLVFLSVVRQLTSTTDSQYRPCAGSSLPGLTLPDQQLNLNFVISNDDDGYVMPTHASYNHLYPLAHRQRRAPAYSRLPCILTIFCIWLYTVYNKKYLLIVNFGCTFAIRQIWAISSYITGNCQVPNCVFPCRIRLLWKLLFHSEFQSHGAGVR